MSEPKQLDLPSEGECKIEAFQKRQVRKTHHEGEWWFSVKDVLEALVDTTDGTRYVADLRRKDPGLDAGYSEITRTLSFQSAGGKQNTTFINIEGIFRLMQSVPSTRAERFKRWLAKVGFERIQETQDPQLIVKRAVATYRAKGYDDEWIVARIRNKASRDILTDEWNSRGIIKYVAILTDAISLGTFDITTGQHKEIKGLKGQSLRDNMTPIELTLTTLAEQATHEITKTINADSPFQTHRAAAYRGGRIAGTARKNIENATGQKVVSPQNYLTPRQVENNSGLNEALEHLLSTGKSD
jgi:prophage antirepressor-like protein